MSDSYIRSNSLFWYVCFLLSVWTRFKKEKSIQSFLKCDSRIKDDSELLKGSI